MAADALWFPCKWGGAEPWGGVDSNCLLLQDCVALPVTAANGENRKALEKVCCRPDGVEFLEYTLL